MAAAERIRRGVVFGLLAAATALADAPPTWHDALPEVRRHAAADLPELLAFYRDLHQYPELSLHEARTAGKLAEAVAALGFEVTRGVGGHGVVAVLKNGDGPTLMVRADMDALPVTENTSLPYASKQQTRREDGAVVGTMHACGHDMHMTCWLGAARILSKMKPAWHGTLVFIGQPAEERGMGAKLMLDAGLFEKFPKPTMAIALHCDSYLEYGKIGYTEGPALANVDSVDITVRGRGGHGSAPHTTIDPVVLAARIVVDLQTIVSREIDPLDAAVVTVGSIHGGSKHNIIPSEVKMQLTVRSFKDTTRKHLLEAIARIAKATAAGARAPEPIVKHDFGEFTPAMINDISLTRRCVAAVKAALGASSLEAREPVMGGEDFSRYALAGARICMLRLGTVEPATIAKMKQGAIVPPSLHSEFYAPVPEPSAHAGVMALTAAALELLNDGDPMDAKP